MTQDWPACVAQGWAPIVEDAVHQLEDEGATILQVKEKFGGLRIYVAGATPATAAIIDAAEREAAATCEYCGGHEGVTNRGARRPDGTMGYWLKTLCTACHHARDTREGGV